MPITALTLDIAKNRTGWALGNSSETKRKWGVFETVDFEKNEGQNLLDFTVMLENLYRDRAFTHLVYEAVYVDLSNQGKMFQFNGTKGQFMLLGAALLFCADYDIKPFEVGVSNWRSNVFGIGKVPKEHAGGREANRAYWKKLAIKYCLSRDWYVTHDDEAEALCILEHSFYCLDQQYEHRNGPLFRRQELDGMMRRGLHADP